MLTFIEGRAGFGKTTKLWQQLQKDITEHKAKRYLVLVPEQFSFSAEKELARFLTNRLAINVEVTSFKKLAREILQRFERESAEFPDDITEKALVLLAVHNVQKKLKFYKELDYSSGMENIIAKFIKSIKAATLTKADFEEAIKTQTGALKAKLTDLYAIYDEYNNLSAKEWQDYSALSKASNILAEHLGVFEKTNFYVDAFYSFSPAELDFLKTLLRNCNLFLTIQIDSSEAEPDVFYAAKNTQNILTEFAKEQGISLRYVKLLAPQRFKSPELKHIEQNLLKFRPNKFEDKINCFKIVQAQDCYEEIKYVAAEILKLVKEKQFRFKDILIIARDTSAYSSIIKAQFSKCGIEYFEDSKQPAKNTVLIKLILSLISVLQTNFQTSAVLNLAKNPLLGFNTGELGQLERYCKICGVDGDDWSLEFTQKLLLEGFNGQADDQLAKLNEIRLKLIIPILKIKESERNLKDSKQLAAMIFEYVLESGAKQRLEKLSAASAQKTADGAAAWGQFVFLLDKFVDFCEKYNANSYKLNLALLNMFFADACFEFMQQGLDQVLISSAEKVRPFNPKAVFIIGANSCNFPKFEGQNDIFSWAEKNKFKSLAFNRLFDVCSGKNNDFADPKINMANDEKLIFYNSITAASEMVFVSFVKNSVTGAKLNPSVFVEKLQSMFEGLEYQEAKDIIKDKELICNKQTAIEVLSECYGTNTELEAALLELLAADENFARLKSRLTFKSIANAQQFKITERELLKKLQSKKWKISPTALENFTICRFKYFCRDVLNLNTEKELKIQKKDIGSILHFVLYFVFKKYYKNTVDLTGEIDFLNLLNAKKQLVLDSEQKEELQKLVKLAINNYFKSTIGRAFNKTAHEEYICAQIENIARIVLYNVIEELKHSDFLPGVFEAKLNEDYKYKDFDITLEGKIDRVDLLQIKEDLWIRVIDYKSGRKRFSLVDIYNGLYYQVLFYMRLLLNLKAQTKLLPAGALYMPIKSELLAQEASGFTEVGQAFKAPKMYGVVVDNQEVLKHMEEDLGGKIIPASVNKDGEFKSSSSVFTINQFNLVFNYMKKLIEKHFDFIEDGDFRPIPLKFNDYDVCKTCEYHSICGFEEDDEKRAKECIPEEEFWNALMVE